ncbi:MAG TPA: SGNH/GDSL hydrolase family protein [Smithella sp.]|nr:SGNH/GDSL hydrolase family protein [Smithella sp.]HRS96831.1 SGNH/GDSL hydrolase family protein [Smithella sp.]
MIYENVELHNVDHIYRHKNIEGVLLGRIPESVSKNLSSAGQMMMVCPSGSEIRFVSETYPVRLTLSVDKISEHLGEGVITEAHVFFGVFQSRQRFVIKKRKTVLNILMPPDFEEMASRVGAAPFSPRVCRVRLWGSMMGAPVRFHHVEAEGKVRPPVPEELPRIRYLAYGSSLAQGAYASGPHLCYVSLTGQKLGADAINLGSSCSAFCEPAMADYIAGRKDWNFATLALSVNMVKSFSPEEFSERVSYMIDTVAKSDPRRPVFCITIKPFIGDYVGSIKPELFRRLLREAVGKSGRENVYLIEGKELMPDVAAGLSTDLVHLGDYGMIQIAENLVRKMTPILKKHELSA